jgi:hypothetical protein
MRRLPITLLALIVALPACGSTVQSGGSSAAGGADVLADAGIDGLGQAGVAGGGLDDDGLGNAGGVAGGSPDLTGGTSGSSGAGSGSGDVAEGGSGQPPSAGGVSAPTAPGTVADVASGPGMTATEVRIGVPYCNDCAGANAAAGAGQQNPGDTRRYYQTAIDDVNARGGVLGRKLVPVFHEVSAADNIDASAQAACATWTDDTQVAAMFFRGEVIYQCAKKAGVMVWGSGGTKPVFDRYPNLFTPASIRLESLFEKTVHAMVKEGWHKPDATWPTGKIGLLTWNNPEYEYAMKNGYHKGMAAHGLKAEETRYIAVPQNASSIADASAAISSAVLAFRQKGIDHVFIGDGQAGIFAGAGLTLLFLQNAKSQGYYPRYGFNTNNSPDFDSHPQDQLVGMLAIDGVDTERENDEGIELNPVRERCVALMAKRGLPVGDEMTRLLAANACEIAFFAEAIFNKAGSTSLDRVMPAGQALGTSYRSPLTYGTRFADGRRDGLYLFRNLRFDASCSCITYTSKPYEP